MVAGLIDRTADHDRAYRQTRAACTSLSSSVPLGDNRTLAVICCQLRSPKLTVDCVQNCACHWVTAGVAPRTLEPSDAATLWEPRSRAMRCLWMLEEMGNPYQLIEKSTRVDDLHSPEYLKLNPNARIPTLVDGDLVLW